MAVKTSEWKNARCHLPHSSYQDIASAAPVVKIRAKHLSTSVCQDQYQASSVISREVTGSNNCWKRHCRTRIRAWTKDVLVVGGLHLIKNSVARYPISDCSSAGDRWIIFAQDYGNVSITHRIARVSV